MRSTSRTREQMAMVNDRRHHLSTVNHAASDDIVRLADMIAWLRARLADTHRTYYRFRYEWTQNISLIGIAFVASLIGRRERRARDFQASEDKSYADKK